MEIIFLSTAICRHLSCADLSKDVLFWKSTWENIGIEKFKRWNKFLNPIWFVGYTYSPKHRNCKVFTATQIQILVSQHQMALLNNGRLIQRCSQGTHLWKKEIAWFQNFYQKHLSENNLDNKFCRRSNLQLSILKKKRCSAIVISYFYYYLRIQRPSRILTHQDLPLHAPVSIFLLFYPS